ncbi:MAG: hypothetical protein U1G07_25525 [Verrucomicrobiota bacterium]
MQKVTQLEDEFDLRGFHVPDESSQAFLTVMHDVLVHVGDQSKSLSAPAGRNGAAGLTGQGSSKLLAPSMTWRTKRRRVEGWSVGIILVAASIRRSH